MTHTPDSISTDSAKLIFVDIANALLHKGFDRYAACSAELYAVPSSFRFQPINPQDAKEKNLFLALQETFQDAQNGISIEKNDATLTIRIPQDAIPKLFDIHAELLEKAGIPAEEAYFQPKTPA